MTFAVGSNFAPPQTPWEWVIAIVQIVVIDIVLAGDNAVVIALAIRQLAPRQRTLGLLLGSGLAVGLRVGLTFVATRLLFIDYIKVAGGLLVLWIALKLLRDHTKEEESGEGRSARSLWSAVWLILVADVTMSIDNVIAVAGAARDSFALLLFGLALSIPFVVFASNLIAKLMDRHPWIVWLGAAILGDVAGEMIVKDHHFYPPPSEPSFLLLHGCGLAGAVAVLLAHAILRRSLRRRPPP